MAGSPLLIRVRNRIERLRQHRWRTAAYHSTEPHIVMGGAPRSGTTFLRKLFDRHPQVCSGPETKLFVPAAFNLEWLSRSYRIPLPELRSMRAAAPSQAAFIDAFAARVRADAGKERWAEKTPQNIRYLDWILARFAEASVVHVIRDGRDVICSMRQHPDWRWVDGAWQKVLVERPLEWYADRWLADTAAGLAWRGDARYTEVRYEELVAEPVPVLQRLCEGVGIAADAAWLEGAGRRDRDATGSEEDAGPPDEDAELGDEDAGRTKEDAGRTKRPDYEGAASEASVGRWREDLTTAEQREVERRCGSRLRELGYEA
jgi:LPS sulfotransferase NodH